MMGLTPTAVSASLLLATLLLSATLDCAQSQTISKEDMCTSLRSLAKGLDSCTINSDCTCISCNVNINEIGNIPLKICIVDSCVTPVCFDITAGALFSRRVCNTTTINFSIKKTVKYLIFFRRTITVPVSVTVGLVAMPSGMQISIAASVSGQEYTIVRASLVNVYCPTEIQLSKEDMCASMRSLVNSLDSCTINSDCTCVSCNVNINEIGNVPLKICIADPCVTPVCFDITAGALFSRRVCNTITIDFSIKKTVKFLFLRRTVTVPVRVTVDLVPMPPSQIEMTITATISSATFELARATLYIYCPPLPKSREDMCDSVRNLTDALSAGDTVTGTCNISETCLNVNCDLEIQFGSSNLPVSLTVTLLPCQSPFAIYVNAEINLFGQTISLADGNYSGNATIPVSIVFISGTVIIVIIQQDCYILLSVYVDFGPNGKFILIQTTVIVMYCGTTPLPTVLPTPTPTIPLSKSREDVCDSVRNLTSALSSGDTVTGTCTISETCLNVNCALEIQLGSSRVPVSLTVTLLPCQSPFAIYVNAEINLFGRTISLADGNYTGNATIPVSIPFVGSGTVNIVIIQQECGILLSVLGNFGSRKFSLIENANIIMYCNSTGYEVDHSLFTSRHEAR